jgi:hypothetical protein
VTYKQIFVAVACLVLAGCGQEQGPIGFNDATVNINRRMAKAAKDFRDQLAPLTQGKPVDAAALQSAYDRLQHAVDDARSAAKKLTPPKDNQAAQDYYDAFEKFLALDDDLVKGPMKEILTIVTDANVPVADKLAQKEQIMKDVHAKEDAALKELKNKQKDFAKEAGFRTIYDRKPPEKEKG